MPVTKKQVLDHLNTAQKSIRQGKTNSALAFDGVYLGTTRESVGA